MSRTIESEARKLLGLVAAQGVYEPNLECQNEVCRCLGRIQKILENGSRTGKPNTKPQTQQRKKGQPR